MKRALKTTLIQTKQIMSSIKIKQISLKEKMKIAMLTKMKIGKSRHRYSIKTIYNH